LTGLAAVVAVSVSAAAPLSLRPDTLREFDRYVRLTEQRLEGEVRGSSPLLWIDRQPPNVRPALVASLARGEVVSARLQTRDGGKEIDADGALIHHWIGTVLLPGVRLDRVRPVVQSYDRYAEWFGPLIRRARITSRAGDRFNVAMRTEMRKILTVTIDADYAIDYRAVGATAMYVRSLATGIHVVDSAGTPNERRTPAEQTFGFLWRLNTYCAFKEAPEGTYEQCESVSLTRDVPFGLGPIVRPLVSGIPRETLEFTLGQVRRLVGR
jgi:hypothetical protein